MTDSLEIDVLRAVDEALSGLSDKAARERVLRWAWAKHTSKDAAPVEGNLASGLVDRKKTSPKKRASGKKIQPKAKGRSTASIVKDVNLEPKGKESLDAFAGSKKPGSNQEKCVVCVYYLRQELGLAEVSANHVYTCFKHMKWRIPANLPNTLQYTASKDGWLDTSNMGDIKITTIGENLVEHDLPRAPKGAKRA
jgi:hypothetical protein